MGEDDAPMQKMTRPAGAQNKTKNRKIKRKKKTQTIKMHFLMFIIIGGECRLWKKGKQKERARHVRGRAGSGRETCGMSF